MKKSLLTILCTLLSMFAWAQGTTAGDGSVEPYAVLSDNQDVISQDATGVTYGKTLTFFYDTNKSSYRETYGVGPFESQAERGWDQIANQINEVVFDESFANYTTLTSTGAWFKYMGNLKTITGLSNLKTDNVTKMFDMFRDCSSLTRIDLTGFSTNNVQNMIAMFGGCTGLTTLDLSNFNTANVVDMDMLFASCSNLKTVYVGSGWSTASVTGAPSMFDGCTSILGGKGTTYDEYHTNAEYAHIDGGETNPGYFTDKNAPTSYNIMVKVVGNGEVMAGQTTIMGGDEQEIIATPGEALQMYFFPAEGWILSSLEVANTDVTSEVTPNPDTGTLGYLLTVNDTSSVVVTFVEKVATPIRTAVIGDTLVYSTSTEGAKIEYILRLTSEGTVEEWGSSDSPTLKLVLQQNLYVEVFAAKEGMITSDTLKFYYPYTAWHSLEAAISSATELAQDASGNPGVNPEDLESLRSQISLSQAMYDERVAEETDITSMTTALSNICETVSREMTSEPEAYAVLSEDNTVLRFYYDTQKSTRNGISFYDGTDVNWPSSITSVTQAFFDSSFAEFSPTSTANWFNGFTSLTTITGLEFLNTANVTNMGRMFRGCSSLKEFDLGSINTSQVRYMESMFNNCSSLTNLNLSSFNTSNVTSMFGMFAECKKLTELDLSSFETTNTTDMQVMFSSASQLKTIYVGSGWDVSNVRSSDYMFLGCTSLVGGAGTPYDADHVDASYAHIDGGSANPGYFTRSGDSPWVDPVIVAAPEFRFEGDNLTMTAETQNAGIFYKVADLPSMAEAVVDSVVNSLIVTADGQSTYYDQPFELKKAAVVKAIAIIRNEAGTFVSDTTTMVYDYEAWLNLKAAVESGADLYGRAQGNPNVDTQLLEQLQWALNEGDMIYKNRAQMDSFEATHFTQRINELCAQIEAQMAEDEPYAVLSDNNTVLRFYYDKQKSARGGMSVGPFTERRQQGWFSERNTITNVVFDESFANCTSLTSTAYWFVDMVNLTTITDISNLNTDNVTDMYGMFMFCRNLTSLDVNGFNTSNVTNMESMFYECSSLTSLDVSKFNTSKVTNMMAMFQFCSGLTVLDVSKFDMSNVTDLTQMFCECSGLTSLKLGAFNIEKVTDIQGLFYGLSSMRELDLSSINTSNIEGMAMLFQNCTSLTTLNLSNFNTANVANMLQMFFGCTNLKTIYVGDEWTTSQVTNSERMFDGCTALIGGAGTHYDANYVDASYAHIDGGSANPGYFTRNGDSPWVDPVIVAAPEFRFEGDNLTMTTETQNAGIFYKVADLPSMAEAVVDSVVNSLIVTADGQSTYYDQPFELKKAAVVKAIAVIRNETGTFASDTTTMVYDYEAWVNLKAAVESGADLYGRAQGNPNVDTQLLEQLQWALNEGDMIYNQRAQMDSFEAKHFTQRINELCAQIEAQMAEDEPYAVLSDNNTKLTFFYDKKKAANNGMSVGPFAADDDVPWFNQRGNITTVEFDPSFANCTSITRTAYWFYGCKNIVSISGIEYLKTDNVTSMYAMFYECSGLSSLDVSHLITDNVMDMTVMFDGCSKLTTLDVSHFNTANVTSMGYMFYKCSSLTSLDVSHFNTEKVTNMASMFHGCSGLTSLDVSHFNTANVTRIDFMFYSCSGLATLDVSHFNTANVTDMSNLFYDCYRLTSLDVRGFNTANVTDMNWMFTNCSKLTSLDVSHFNTEKVTNMNGMFYGCSGLTSLDVSGFNTANVTGMGSMFSRCSNLTNLDVSGFNTENVTRMASMFEGCSNLTSLDVSHFNTANVTDLRWMFRDCSGLKTIYAGSGWTTAAVTSGNYMFTDCTSLIGGAGTPYDANHTDYTYAHIDGGESNPGYFTDKNAPEGEATFDGLVARVSGERTLDEAFEQRGGRAEAAKTIAAIVWNKETALTDTDLQGITNPNLLIYVKGDSLAPTNRNNIIVDGFAKNIVLTDLVQGNNNFYCPQDFTAEAISYTHEFKQQTQVGVSRGWETIALPFTVQTIMHEKRGVITPFGNSSSNTHFWLRRLTSNGLQAVPMIEANTAYLISMPNSEEYSADFNLAGRVTFSAENAVVPMTEIVKDESADYIMTPVFENTAAKQGVYVLNVGEERNGYPEGSIFESNYRAVLPFQAYTEHKGSNPAPAYFFLGDLGGDTTGIDAILMNSERVNSEAWYTLDGRKLQDKPTQKGVYISNGKKVIIK